MIREDKVKEIVERIKALRELQFELQVAIYMEELTPNIFDEMKLLNRFNKEPTAEDYKTCVRNYLKENNILIDLLDDGLPEIYKK